MPAFEALFEQTNEEKILEKLEEIKQLMVPKVEYVPYPVYIEVPWWKYWQEPCPKLIPSNPCVPYVYPEEYDCIDAMRFALMETYTVDYNEHVCLAGACVST